MEEKPRQPGNFLPEEDRQELESNPANRRSISPGEIFLKKMTGASEQDKSGADKAPRLTESLHEVLPNFISKEPSHKEGRKSEIKGSAEETIIDSRHETKKVLSNSPVDDSSRPSQNRPNEDNADVHHISKVIGDKAREIQTPKQDYAQKPKESENMQALIGRYVKAVSIGFLLAITILLILIFIYLAKN